MSEPPTGEQFELVAGDHRAAVVELGAGLRSYALGGVELLDTYHVSEVPGDACRGEVLLPFANRVDGGRYDWEGSELRLPLSEPELGHAIHGSARFMNWHGERDGHDRVSMTLVLRPSKGYPFTLSLGLDYRLATGGLEVRTLARNVGASRAPFVAGYHPYFATAAGGASSASLRVPATTYLTLDERLIPTGRAEVAGTPVDFRAAKQIGDLEINACFTDLERDADGLARVQLEPGDGRPAITVAMDSNHEFVQLFTGDTLAPSQARRGVAIEPMTGAPNAFRDGHGLIALEPGEGFEGVWRIEPSA